MCQWVSWFKSSRLIASGCTVEHVYLMRMHGGGEGECSAKKYKRRCTQHHVVYKHIAQAFLLMLCIWQGLCAVHAWKGCIFVHPLLAILLGCGCMLEPLGRKAAGHKLPERFIQTIGPSQGQDGGAGHKKEAPGLNQYFSGLDLACCTHVKFYIGTTCFY